MRDFAPRMTAQVKGRPSTISAGCPDYAPQADLPAALPLVSEVPVAAIAAIRGTRVTEYLDRSAGLVRLDVSVANHLCPFLGFLRDQVPKISGRPGNHCRAQVGEPRLDPGIG